ncbi:hypothetical protein [Marinomonas sp. 2405UD68-3]|uniref:hypothetical protein n=1 Tax=Marinomonas sp. 2405UD68-3 TaxID=3391835 RepID=UPI0039C986CF
MNFLMTSAPLAMHMHGHSQESANLGMQWHVIAMYAPSFFTGKLILRFGATRISALGIILTAISAVIGFFGEGVYYFWANGGGVSFIWRYFKYIWLANGALGILCAIDSCCDHFSCYKI